MKSSFTTTSNGSDPSGIRPRTRRLVGSDVFQSTVMALIPSTRVPGPVEVMPTYVDGSARTTPGIAWILRRVNTGRDCVASFCW